MHSRIFVKAVSISLRTGFLGVSLAGFASAGENFPSQPMSGACFLHDTGLEYIPTRLLGAEDIAADADRGESSTWTCTDTSVDCAEQAERYAQRQAAIEQWSRWHSTVDSLRSRAMRSLPDIFANALRRWNASLAAIGSVLVRGISIAESDEIIRPPQNADFASEFNAMHCMGDIPLPRFEKANVFVFALGGEIAEQSEIEALEQQRSIDANRIASPSDRTSESMSGTSFARDYCIFAPYPLSSEIMPENEVGDRCDGAKPDSARDASGEIDTRSILQMHQRAATDLQRSASRALARNLSWLGKSLLDWSEQLDSSVRMAEAQDALRANEVK